MSWTIMKNEIKFRDNPICCISDIHIGVHQNGGIWHRIVLEWARWLDKQLQKKKIQDISAKKIKNFKGTKIQLQLLKSGVFWQQKNIRKFLETSVIISL